MSIFGGQASLIANDFFDQLAELAGEDMTSEMYQNVNTERVNNSLHYYAKNLVEGHNDKFEKSIVDGDIGTFNGKVQDLTPFLFKTRRVREFTSTRQPHAVSRRPIFADKTARLSEWSNDRATLPRLV